MIADDAHEMPVVRLHEPWSGDGIDHANHGSEAVNNFERCVSFRLRPVN